MKEPMGIFQHAQPALELKQAVAELRQCLETVLSDVTAAQEAPEVVSRTQGK